MRRNLSIIIILVLSGLLANKLVAQDCIDYQLKSCPRLEPNPYSVVPEGSQSLLMKPGEEMMLSFFIYQGRDYRISLCSNMYGGEITLKVWDADDPTLLLYDNALNDMAQVFEFQVFNTRRVRAIVGLKQKESKKKNAGMLTEKIPRDCVGILLETMVTRK